MHISLNQSTQRGCWIKDGRNPGTDNHIIKTCITNISNSIACVDCNGQMAVTQGGRVILGDPGSSQLDEGTESLPLLAYVPPLPPENLGGSYFKKRHHLKYAYIMGAMANGISSVELVREAGRAGMLGFFGAGGLLLEKIESAINQIQNDCENIPFGFNLIHSPADPELEKATVELYLKYGISLVSASAYLDLTLPLVYYRVKGIHKNKDGQTICPNRIIAKVSRIEVARKFLSPPPEKFLNQLLQDQSITDEEADLAHTIPMADDLTAEADSGGHTDNQPAIALLPTMLALRNDILAKFKYYQPIGVGLAGGISTPESAAAAFALGADYILTGSVNQACVEAGTSETVRKMLSEASQSDVTMAPAADMFEMGIKVQVLKRGTMFPFRASKLYDLYCKYPSIEMIPGKDRMLLERDFFKKSFQEEWEQTRTFFESRDSSQISRAHEDPKYKMALIFRSYLGQSSTWANQGELSRKIDYQIWCGPAMGAFNEWVKGSFLQSPENRKVVTIAMNLLFGAAVVTRVNWLRNQGISLPPLVEKFSPMKLSEIYQQLKPT